MIATHERRTGRTCDPADWKCCVRRLDGAWLARPAPEPGAPVGNADPWTRRLSDMWDFDSEREAHAAAEAHGLSADGYTIHHAPRRAGEWLKGEGAYAPPETRKDR